MSVIYFPGWRVHAYLDDDGQNVLRRWLDKEGISAPDRAKLQTIIDMIEYGGPRTVAGTLRDVGSGFSVLVSGRKEGGDLSPVFCYGPFSETEITFLVGARLVRKHLTPSYAVGIAAERLEMLRQEPQRRRRERIT